MNQLKVYLFGVPRVALGEQDVPVKRRKMLALLAYLLISGQPHSRESLATRFWPEFDLSSALANLRRDLSRLKEAVGGNRLRIERDRVQLDLSAGVWSDVAQFEEYLRQAREHGHFRPGSEIGERCETCQAALEAAGRLYTGSFLSGFNLPDSPAFDEWQFFQSERLNAEFAAVLQHLAQWHIQQGEYEQALEPARRWVALDALHEPAQRLVMQLYAWSGQPSAARRQYNLLVDLLHQELDAEPEPETQALIKAIQARRLSPPASSPQPEPGAVVLPQTGAPARTPSKVELPASGPARFLTESRVSTGGFGEIYLGIDRLTGKQVAIKRLRGDLVERQPEQVERFVREGQLLGRLSHPNIVPMLDFFEHEGQYNLVMEYLPGGTLRDLLEREQRLPIERALDIALELADALTRAHHLHILHRDLKPENILLDATGHPRLIDFGLALLESKDMRLTQAGMLIGSPAYMSPEALRGQERDARSDIWGFGALLYEMVAGRAPFQADQIHSLIQQILYDPLPPLHRFRTDAPLALEHLIGRMLEKDPEKRLPTMRQAAAELEAIRSGKAQSVTPPDDSLPTSTFAQAATGGRLLEFPPLRTPLIGRELELAQLREMFNNPNCRLITLVGTGGIGKTRLAIEAATRFAGSLADGAVFVHLSPVQEVDDVVPAIAHALHMRFSPGAESKDQLINRLKDERVLLVLDNFEHLLEAAGLLTEILSAAPRVLMIVTSRERLNLQEEFVVEVEGLPYPPPGEPVPGGAESWLNSFSAVQLFVDRARRADPNLPVDAGTLADIIRICQIVEGMPLALELAAPWVRAMTCAEIVQELTRGMDLLTTTMRNLPERHRSVRMVFEQSWQSLAPHEQRVMAALSVFHGGCTREAAEKVADARPSVLMALVDKALLRFRGNRYSMHELVRQYAEERLKQDEQQREQILDKHHAYFLDLLDQMASWLKGGRQFEASTAITADYDNIRAAWRHALQRNDRQAIGRAAEPYWLYNDFRGTLPQGKAAFREAADVIRPEQGDLVLAGFLRAAHGCMLARMWQFERGRELIENGLRLLRVAPLSDPKKTAFALAWYGFMLVIRGHFAEALKIAQESLDYYEQTGDEWTRAGALRLLGASNLYLGNLQTAEEYLNQCIEVCKAIGELRIRTYATSNLGVVHLWYGQLDRAREYFNESLRVSISCNDRLSRADALTERGRLYLATGEYERAVETARSCISIYQQLGRSRVSLANIVLGKALRLMKAPGAEEALREGLEAARAVDHKPDIAAGLEGLGSLAVDREQYSAALRYFDESMEFWKSIGNEPEIATLSCRRAYAMLVGGNRDFDAIRGLFIGALRTGRKHQSGALAMSAMVGLAALQLLSGEGDSAQAIEMLNIARIHPATPHEVRVQIDIWERQLPNLPARSAAAEEDARWQTLAERWLEALSPAGD